MKRSIRSQTSGLLTALALLSGIALFVTSSENTSSEAPGSPPNPASHQQKQPAPAARAAEASMIPSLDELVADWESLQQTPDRRTARLEAYREERLALMRTDPQKFLETAISLQAFAALPADLQKEVDQPYSAVGEMRVTWATSKNENGQLSCEHGNRFHANGETLHVFHPAGEKLPVQAQQAVNGVRLGHQLVVNTTPLERLTPEQRDAAITLFPEGNPDGIDPITQAPGTTAALVGGQVFVFSDPAMAEQVSEVLVDESANRFTWLAGDTGGDAGSGDPQATPYAPEQIDVLFIRIDFSDFPGEPISQAALESTLATVDGYIDDFSYNAATINYTVTSQLYRMPSTGASYALSASGDDDLQTDARALASANYTINNYDVIALYFTNLGTSNVPGSNITYGGLASIGANGATPSSHWINGFNSVDIILHEFGHNYGLYHANYYHPEQQLGGTYQAPGSLEYGDIFDTMGSGDVPEAYFNHLALNQLDWLPDGKVAEATADGTWRIYRFDDPSALNNNTLALKVPVEGGNHYWVGYRQRYTSATYNLSTSAYVVGENLANARETSLIDMTPESQASETDDRRDAGLPVGSSYYHTPSGVTFEAVARGGTAPNEWIDVQITFLPLIGFESSLMEIDEQAGTAQLQVTRGFSTSGAVSVDFATSDGTATSPADYYATTGTLTWADGDGANKIISIPIRPDVINDGTESFTVTLSNASGAILDSGADTMTVNILDPGQRFTTFAPPFMNNTVNTTLPLSNGKVIIGGNLYQGIVGNIGRLNTDGSEDTTFVSGTGFNDEVEIIVEQPDGSLLVGGDFTSYNGTACNRLVKLSANGTLDGSFNLQIGTGPDQLVQAIAIENSGKILVGGDFSTWNGTSADGLIRLNADGSIDSVNALNLPFNAGFGTSIYDILVEPDGKIMVAGYFYIGWTGSGFRSGIARLNTDGSRDIGFDPDAGAHSAGSNSSLRPVYTVKRNTDGSYLLGGWFTAYDENPAPYVARITQNGFFDSTFTPPAIDSSIYTAVSQANGSTVVGGYVDSPFSGIGRLDNSGNTDSSFQQGTGMSNALTIEEDPEGNLFVGGNFFSYNGVSTRPVIKIAGGVSPYDLWVAENFTAAQIAAGDADPDADPDSDGIVNLAELAMQLNPNTPDAASLFAVDSGSGIEIIDDNGSDYLQITLTKTGNVSGPWYLAQFSSDLSTWSPASPTPSSSGFEIVENSASRIVIRDTVAITPGTPRFGRIVISSPE